MLKSNVEIKEKSLVDETVGEHIGYDLGVKMVKDYYDAFGEGGAQFVGKNILQQILAQPGCIGLNIYKALNEKGEKTYVLVGLDKSNNPILEITSVNTNGILEQQEGIVADRNFGLGWFDTVKK
ncbi:MAG: hypothetical protein ACK5AO_00020 [bacterium]